jgi:poly [ADP-ribose] polymerase 7/11/12/13
MKKKKKSDPKELDLFHGTRSANVDVICEQGFDWRICGSRNGTAYGKGTYFAVAASMSAQYTDNMSMLVCKVLVGDYCQGSPTYVRPPVKTPGTNQFYDSCVDNPANPQMYIIFKSEQAYPEYIIKYT